jgi:hypothetical protein
MTEDVGAKIQSERKWIIILSGISGFILFTLVLTLSEVLQAPECFTTKDTLLPIIFIIITPIMSFSSWIFLWSGKKDLAFLFSIVLALLSLGSCFIMFLLAGGLVYCSPM